MFLQNKKEENHKLCSELLLSFYSLKNSKCTSNGVSWSATERWREEEKKRKRKEKKEKTESRENETVATNKATSILLLSFNELAGPENRLIFLESFQRKEVRFPAKQKKKVKQTFSWFRNPSFGHTQNLRFWTYAYAWLKSSSKVSMMYAMTMAALLEIPVLLKKEKEKRSQDRRT